MKTFSKMTRAKKENLEKELVDKVKFFTGIDDLVFSIEVVRPSFKTSEHGDERLRVTSNELAHSQSPKMFKSLEIANFGGDWSTLEYLGMPGCSEKDDGTYWLPLKYQYTHFGGGRNGSDVATFWISPDGQILNYRNDLE